MNSSKSTKDDLVKEALRYLKAKAYVEALKEKQIQVNSPEKSIPLEGNETKPGEKSMGSTDYTVKWK